MTTTLRPREGGSKTTVALALAAIWSVGLVIAAAVMPVYQGSSSSSSTSLSSTTGAYTAPQRSPVVTNTSATLLQENGPRVLLLVGIPVLVVVVVGLALWRRRATAKRGAGPVAWAVVGLLAAFTLVAMLSIGIVVLPVTALLVVACALA